MSYYPIGQCKVALQGLHHRNTYNDVISTELTNDDVMTVSVGRNSIYNSLPEYMFHPIDRFDNLPKYEEKERFQEQLDMQEEEIRNAYRFFAPIDVLLLKLRSDVRAKLEPLASENVVLQHIIGDSITDEQRSNRFIRQLIPFLPDCKNIRGNRTLLTLLLRKVFMEEGMRLDPASREQLFTDEEPHYENRLDMTLGESFVGNSYNDQLAYFSIHYWSDDECQEDILKLDAEIEQLRAFVVDWFLAVGEEMVFNICHDEPPLRLSDDKFHNYLGYNTNI